MNGTDTTGLQRLRGSRRVGWRTILGLLLVPLTAAGVLLWGLWNPTDRLDTMTAAVVNLDEPVTVNGQMVPLGRVLAGKLVGEASVAVEVKTVFFSETVTARARQKFAGSNGDPTFAELMAPPTAQGDRPWDLYCAAFSED